jgi:hypothetical protein
MNPLNPLTKGVIRWGLNAFGVWIVSKGILPADFVGAATPYLETIIGAALSIGSLAWNVKTHTPSGIGKQLASLKPGPEGQTQPQV